MNLQGPPIVPKFMLLIMSGPFKGILYFWDASKWIFSTYFAIEARFVRGRTTDCYRYMSVYIYIYIISYI